MAQSPHTDGERGIVPDWRAIGITRTLEGHDPMRVASFVNPLHSKNGSVPQLPSWANWQRRTHYLVFFNPDCLVTVPACSTRHHTGATDSFQPVIPLIVRLDNQGACVPCEARIVGYATGRTSSRQLKDTTQNAER